MKTIPPDELGEPFYSGSVQRLYAVPGDDSIMVTQTTLRGSVFDVGALFEIPGNDVARAVFRHVLFTKLGQPETWQQAAEAIQSAPEMDEAYRKELLSGPLERCLEEGARTHHRGMLDAATGEVCEKGLPANPSAFNIVRRFQILKPTRDHLFDAHLFDYSQFPHEDGFVIPLEYIVRFGITSGSSVFRKYQKMGEGEKKAFEKELGVSKPLEAWQMLERPITDFTSKFEPEDRMVSKQEALVMSGIPGAQFVESAKLGILGGWVVRHLLEGIGLRLWDLKWEFAKDGDDLVFVDTIDTDSFRATSFIEYCGHTFVMNFNKQSMRDYFRIACTDWIAAIDDAKKRAADAGVPFTEILKAGQEAGTYAATPDVPVDFTVIQVQKTHLIQEYMLGRKGSEEVKEALQRAGEEEIAFYDTAGHLEAFAKLNCID